MADSPLYAPIDCYGAIGNTRSVALVGPGASIDWCCLPHLDSPSVFAAILDARRGGRFRIQLASSPPSEPSYVPDTNVLRTRSRDDHGVLEVLDFMPVEHPIDGRCEPVLDPAIHRMVRCTAGTANVVVEWAPRLAYATQRTSIARTAAGFVARAGDDRLGLGGVGDDARIEEAEDGAPFVCARMRLAEGEERHVVTRWGDASPETGSRGAGVLQRTLEAWRRWLGDAHQRVCRDWAEPWEREITRSELALKLLCIDSGAIAAASTTSLPETIGGVRNWDYRYAWLRDAGMTSQALVSLGHVREASRFLGWVESIAERRPDKRLRLQIMYGVRGQETLEEEELAHLEGYRGSRPVRIGNEAAGQRQHDIYGEVMDAAFELVRSRVGLHPSLPPMLTEIADAACRTWRDPDSGIWEIRGPERHYTHSKVLSWVCLDRAIRLAKRGVLHGDVPRWRRCRDEVFQTIMDQAWSERAGAFVQSFGAEDLDASNLLMPIHELLPCHHPRVQKTIHRTLEHLTVDGLVYRYRCDDHLPGEEGAFVLTSFWLVDALALSGRVDDACTHFERLVKRLGPLGLFSEQIDPRDGAFLGNHPQAFSHLGVINSALYIAHALGNRLPKPPLLGTPESEERD
jgi:GH15 family glucan-1,4-alpha-glucosidase